jgi:glutaredoxin 3
MIVNVEVYSKANCVYCNRAKKLLETNNIPYQEKKLDVHFTRQHILEKFPDAKTFPIIVVDGFNIGGYSQLQTLLTEQYSQTKQLLNE